MPALPPRTTRQILWLTSVLCLLAAVTLLFLPNTKTSASLDPTTAGVDSDAPVTNNTATDKPRDASSNINAKQWVTQLQRPLFDPPPPPKPVAPPPPPLRIELVGTVISGDRYTAMIQTPREGTKLVAVGQVVEDAEILTIEQDRVTVRYHGQERVLEKQNG